MLFDFPHLNAADSLARRARACVSRWTTTARCPTPTRGASGPTVDTRVEATRPPWCVVAERAESVLSVCACQWSRCCARFAATGVVVCALTSECFQRTASQSASCSRRRRRHRAEPSRPVLRLDLERLVLAVPVVSVSFVLFVLAVVVLLFLMSVLFFLSRPALRADGLRAWRRNQPGADRAERAHRPTPYVGSRSGSPSNTPDLPGPRAITAQPTGAGSRPRRRLPAEPRQALGCARSGAAVRPPARSMHRSAPACTGGRLPGGC